MLIKEVKQLTIGNRIKKIRSAVNPKITQEEFAASIGKTRAALSVYELDRVTPDDSVLLLISKTYGVRYEWLKTGEEPMYPPETDDLLIKVAKVMEGQSEAKRQLVELICDLPDALLDQLIEYYDQKMTNKKK